MVLVQKMEPMSIIDATQLQKGDVIIHYDDKSIKTTMDLMNVYQKYIWKEHLDIVIYRNQKPIDLTIKTKK